MADQPTASDQEIFQHAVSLPTEERAAYLDQACGDDSELRREVESLLEAYADATNFLEWPAINHLDDSSVFTHSYEPLAERPGTSIGPYKLMEQIGEGGFGLVFVADQHQPVRRKVALKIIKPGMDSRDVIARFEAERQALALMDHPNIAKVFDAGATESGRPYFVMELVRGIPITEYCDRHHLAPRERLNLFISVSHAIQHAHQKGIIHRDVKPTNVLVTTHDGRPVVKVIDFGVAKALSQQLTEQTIYTQFAQMIGTPLYMSPEQAEMSGLDIDTRSDIYSLGVLLYELLTGATPFDRERLKKAAIDEIRRIIRDEEPLKPSTKLSQSGEQLSSIAAVRATEPAKLAKLVRGDLDWIVMKCLEKDRNRRYESATGLAHDIERYLNDEPVEASPPSAWYRLRKTVWRNKRSFAAIAAVASALVIGTAVSLYFAAQASLRAEEARRNLVTAREETNRADKIARQAMLEREESQDSLVHSLYNEARATLSAGQPGRRWHALDALQKAEALRTRDRSGIRLPGGDVPTLPSTSELRSVAVAALQTSDARLVRETMISDFLNFVAGVTSGQAGHIAISNDGSIAAAEFVDLSERSDSQADTSHEADEIDPSLQALRVIDVRTGRELLSPTGKAYGHLPGCFSLDADGKLLAVGEAMKSGLRIKIWKMSEFQTAARELSWSQYVSSDHPEPRHQLIFSPNGKHLAYVRHGYKQIDVAVWDLETGEEKTFREEQEHGGYEGPGGITPDSASLVIRTGLQRITMVDLGGDDPPSRFELPNERGTFQAAFALHPPHREIVSVGGIVWDYRNNRVVAGADNPMVMGSGALTIDSQGKHLAIGGVNGLAVYQLPMSDPVLRVQQSTGAIKLCWAADGRQLVLASKIGALQTWEIALGEMHRVIPIDGGPVRGYAFSPDGRWLGVWNWNDARARLINLATGKTEREYQDVDKLVFDSNGERVAVLPPRRAPGEAEPDVSAEYATEPMVIIADVATGEELWRLPVQGSIVSAAFNREGDLIAAIDAGNAKPEVWNIKTNRLVCELPGGTNATIANSVILSADGRLATVNSVVSRQFEPQHVTVFDLESGTRISLLESTHRPTIYQFSDDNRFVAGAEAIIPRVNEIGRLTATAMSARVFIWILPEGRRHCELGPYAEFNLPGECVFSPDASLFVVPRRDGVMELWDVERNEELFRFQTTGRSGQCSFTADGRMLAWPSASDRDGESQGYIEFLDLSVLKQQLRGVNLDW